jgi:hypothetical protein
MIANLFISAAARAAPVPKQPGEPPRISPGCRSGSNVSPRETEALLGLFRTAFVGDSTVEARPPPRPGAPTGCDIGNRRGARACQK